MAEKDKTPNWLDGLIGLTFEGGAKHAEQVRRTFAVTQARFNEFFGTTEPIEEPESATESSRGPFAGFTDRSPEPLFLAVATEPVPIDDESVDFDAELSSSACEAAASSAPQPDVGVLRRASVREVAQALGVDGGYDQEIIDSGALDEQAAKTILRLHTGGLAVFRQPQLDADERAKADARLGDVSAAVKRAGAIAADPDSFSAVDKLRSVADLLTVYSVRDGAEGTQVEDFIKGLANDLETFQRTPAESDLGVVARWLLLRIDPRPR